MKVHFAAGSFGSTALCCVFASAIPVVLKKWRLDRQQYAHPLQALEQVVSAEELKQAQTAIKDIYIDKLVKEYIIDIVRHPDTWRCVSRLHSRGALALYRLCQAKAATDAGDYVLPTMSRAGNCCVGASCYRWSRRVRIKGDARRNRPKCPRQKCQFLVQFSYVNRIQNRIQIR